MQTELLKVSGMTCGGCVSKVTNALKTVSGVGDVKVSLSAGKATVQFDERRTSPDKLKSAVTGAGYAVQGVRLRTITHPKVAAAVSFTSALRVNAATLGDPTQLAADERPRAGKREAQYRVWKLYMAASALQFEQGGLDAYQILAANRDGRRVDLPLTRRDLYQ
jgi:copper chaperone CopZ